MVILVRGSAGPRTRTLAIPNTTGPPAADEEAGWEEGHILFGGDSSSSRLLRRLVLGRHEPAGVGIHSVGDDGAVAASEQVEQC